jgi:hypothetical protein
MVMYDLPNYKNKYLHLFIYFQNIINMPCDNFYFAMCYNLRPSLTIIMNNGNQYFKNKIIFMSKKFHNATC